MRKRRDAKIGGVRSMIGVPLLREGETIGAIALARNRVEPFTDRETELVATFADQVVIAIENVRLFEAEQQRTRELSESLQQQTATSEVLQVISSSPGELQGVFDVILDKVVRICQADTATLFLHEKGTVRRAARHSAGITCCYAKRAQCKIRDYAIDYDQANHSHSRLLGRSGLP